MIRIAMWILRRAMERDPEYAWGWHCSLAVFAQDAGADWERSNERACDFMLYTFDCDTSREFKRLLDGRDPSLRIAFPDSHHVCIAEADAMGFPFKYHEDRIKELEEAKKNEDL